MIGGESALRCIQQVYLVIAYVEDILEGGSV